MPLDAPVMRTTLSFIAIESGTKIILFLAAGKKIQLMGEQQL
jgi:hypothetical protein